ncbi:NAD(P)H-dependent flavin oxidoreductase [Nannocystis pusilla]|uniref:NAD(P)H-dependent flavin oxidoreductase n=1 Tax=Nannocystis pusilla TaxID=889268 RepID=UPI003BF077D6
MTDRRTTSALPTRWPIVQAPMAGGPDTPELAAAVSNAGGLGSLGCAYMTPQEIEATAAKLRSLTSQPFALNLFVRADAPDDPAATARVSPVLAEFRRELGLPSPPPSGRAAPEFEAQLEAVLQIRPAVFSFTFGAPTRAQIEALHARSIAVIGTATTVEEAVVLAALGVDAVCAQGAEAGGHRGTFLGAFEDGLVGTITLVPQIAARVQVPVIAAGGIMEGRAIRAMLDIGAAGVQLGTAFMTCPEAGTSEAHRAALATAWRTVVTRAFSGRPARGVRNRFSEAFAAVEAAPFPQQQGLTRDIRAAAAAQGRADLMQLWAGQGAPMGRALPAEELVALLVREAGLAT